MTRFLKRLRSITWDELRTRAQQELSKHWDLARYRLNPRFAGQNSSAIISHTAQFFFSSIDVPELIAELKKRFPSDAELAIRYAERICKHEFDLLGFQRLSYGSRIDWHLDPVHAKRAPLKPWFEIRYLDFEEVGDSKIIWELNRHQHLVTLAKAYRLTGNEQFAAELFAQWYDWHRDNPYPMGINWASSLEVSFRTISWLWIWNLMADSPALPSDFSSDLQQALIVGGRHIEKYLSTYFSPNTHLLGEGVALFFLGTLFPDLRGARRWHAKGWNIVLKAAECQVRTDGMYFEQSTYYHVYALDFFIHARILAAANGLPIPPEFDQTIEKMLNFLAILAQSDAAPRLGDDDGGRLFDPLRNCAKGLVDPLATGAVLFNRPNWKAAAGGPREETLWLLGRRGLAQFDSLVCEPQLPRSASFAESGIYVMADLVTAKAQLVIDAGPQGSLSAGHGHADALSVHFSAAGRELLLDPGTYCYVSGDSCRDKFRGTAAHNTLQVDESDQAEPRGPFSWEALTETRVESWVRGKSFELFRGSHSGYARLSQPVLHRRWILHLKSQFWLVRDVALGSGEHSLDISWHVGPRFAPVEESLGSILFDDGSGSRFALLTDGGTDWRRKSAVGWWSPVYGKKEPAPVIHFRRRSELPVEFYSLFLVLTEGAREVGCLTSTNNYGAESAVSVCVYENGSSAHYMVFSESGKKWRVRDIESDARFAHCEFDRENRLRHFELCDGSAMNVGGKSIFAAEHSVPSHEWHDETGQPALVAMSIPMDSTEPSRESQTASRERIE